MAEFKCEKCGATKDTRCKPQKCPACNEQGTMVKQDKAPTGGCGCGCKKK